MSSFVQRSGARPVPSAAVTPVEWLAEVTSGPVTGAVVALLGVGVTMHFTLRNNIEERTERRATQLRDEVAALLGKESTTKTLHSALFYRSPEDWMHREHRGGEIARRDAVFAAREPYIEQCAKLRQLAIRIVLYAEDKAILYALDAFRELRWDAPMTAATSEDPRGRASGGLHAAGQGDRRDVPRPGVRDLDLSEPGSESVRARHVSATR